MFKNVPKPALIAGIVAALLVAALIIFKTTTGGDNEYNRDALIAAQKAHQSLPNDGRKMPDPSTMHPRNGPSAADAAQYQQYQKMHGGGK